MTEGVTGVVTYSCSKCGFRMKRVSVEDAEGRLATGHDLPAYPWERGGSGEQNLGNVLPEKCPNPKCDRVFTNEGSPVMVILDAGTRMEMWKR